MRFGIFYEHQIPRPWTADDEHTLLKNALEQVELADRVGFDYVWEVEHHFLEEYSHSSAPEVFLAACSQRTRRIRLGHGIIQIPHGVNHPARVAERVATLDLISGGRVEFGTGESSSAAELGGFLVDRNEKRAQWEDAIDAITRMFVEEPFAGWDSPHLHMPPRNVVPKPFQKPHPPLWVACSRRETIHFAARNGIGALSFSFVEPEDAAKWVREYQGLIASAECVPAGFAVNPNLTVVVPMMCHQDESVAIDRGIDGAHFFGYSLAHYYGLAPHDPGRTNVWKEFLSRRDKTGFARSVISANMAPLGVKVMQQGLGSLRGAIGTPGQIRDLIRRYDAAGVDQVAFVLQAGRNRHEHICESLELFGKEVLPEFASEAPRREREKLDRLAPAIQAAMARKKPPRKAEPYRIDEMIELERARRAAREAITLRSRIDDVRRGAKEQMRKRGRAVFASFVRGKNDAELDARFGRPMVQQALFTTMARAFEPRMAFGFKGDIVYELRRATDGAREPQRWTIRVDGRHATALRSDSEKPAIRIGIDIPDFVRMIVGEINPALPLLEGRVTIEGDLALATRLNEMFGGPSQF